MRVSERDNIGTGILSIGSIRQSSLSNSSFHRSIKSHLKSILQLRFNFLRVYLSTRLKNAYEKI